MLGSKIALASKTLWGLVAIAVPYLDQVYAYAQQIPEGILPKPVSVAVTGLGLALAWYGRLKARLPIAGIVSPPKYDNF
jgi:hypothetical protein